MAIVIPALLVDGDVVEPGPLTNILNLIVAAINAANPNTLLLAGAGSTPITALYHTNTGAISPASVAAATTAEQIFPVAGVVVNDVVNVSKPTAQAGLGIAGVRVSSNGNIGITFVNATAGAIVPTAAETYQVSGIR